MPNGGDKRKSDAKHYRRTASARRPKAAAYYVENREHVLAERKRKVRALKEEVVAAYGGKCRCCGETHIEFLTIDHTDGSGAEHRRACGKGRGVYRDLKLRGYPRNGYQVLCFNCNIALGFFGYCPHAPERKRITDRTPGKLTGRKGRPRTV